MNFFNNRISMGKTKSFDDICKEIIEKKNKKEALANSNQTVKVAASDEEKSSGSIKGPGVPDGTGPGKDSKDCPFNKDKDDDKKDEKCPKCDKEECECEKDEDKKEAKASPKFVKIANLDAKTKTWLKEYWGNIFDKDYADAMISDK